MKQKRCSTCCEMQPMDNYYRCAAKSDGRMSQCKSCAQETTRNSRARQKNKLIEVDTIADRIRRDELYALVQMGVDVRYP